MELDRHIDTTGLPPGFDIADLIESGVTGQALIDWCKARVRPGPPSLTTGEMITSGKAKAAAADKPAPIATPRSPRSNVVPLPDPVPVVALEIPPEFSEDSLAEEFTRQYKSTLAYCAAWSKWLHWDDSRWCEDDTALAVDLSRRVCREASLLALDRPDLGAKAKTIANSISSRRCFAAVEGIARSDRRHVVRLAQFDADPWVLNTPGGILDLKTGDMRAARRSDWCLKQTRASLGGTCPTWIRFLQDSTGGDGELIGYLQRIAGYCLTGSIAEQKFCFIYGTGGNGKGTFLRMLMWLLNDYGRQANMDTFTEQKFSKHASEIAFFQGARLVVAEETNQGQRWNEARIKSMTGGDPITANFMHMNPFTFFPTFKLLFSGNHKPHLKNVDLAIKRRLYLIPFDNSIPIERQDPDLDDKLHAEASGILSWALEGCIDWQKNKLKPPAKVIALTNEYFEAEDRIQTFLDECCEMSAGYKVNTSKLYERFTRWADGQGEYAGGRKGFLDMLAVKGMRSVKAGGEQMIHGVRIAFNDVPQEYHAF